VDPASAAFVVLALAIAIGLVVAQWRVGVMA
jgi:hypothetical protein